MGKTYELTGKYPIWQKGIFAMLLLSLLSGSILVGAFMIFVKGSRMEEKILATCFFVASFCLWQLWNMLFPVHYCFDNEFLYKKSKFSTLEKIPLNLISTLEIDNNDYTVSIKVKDNLRTKKYKFIVINKKQCLMLKQFHHDACQKEAFSQSAY